MRFLFLTPPSGFSFVALFQQSLPNPRGPGQAVAPSSGPRSGRLSCYEDGDPAASAASPRNAALPAFSLGLRIHCGQGPHWEE